MSAPVRTALFTLLDGSPTFVGLVGQRTYGDFAPTSARYPYCTASQSGGMPVRHQGNVSALVMEAWQLDIFARTPKQRDEVFQAIRNRIDGFSGTVDGVDLRSVFLGAPIDQYESPLDGKQDPAYHKIIPLEVWYAQPEPTGV